MVYSSPRSEFVELDAEEAEERYRLEPVECLKSMEKSSRHVIERRAPFTQTKPRDAETIASQVPDKRAVQNKCESYVKSIRRNASAVASMLLAAR
jgi:hypothetical protein